MTAGRGFLLVLGIVVTLAGLTARPTEAQSPRLVKIGALTESWGPTPHIVGLRDGLQELGYRENENFVIGVRFTQGSITELPEAARALVRHGVDLIVATENAATAAQLATTRIPIVFMGGGDPIGSGLVKSFARPGGNITGIADLELELVPKRMEIFRDLIPDLKRVLFVYDAANAVALSRLGVHRDAAHHLGLRLVERPVRTEDEARSVITTARKSEVDGIFSTRLLSLNIPGSILEIAPKRTMPTMFDDAFYVERGGLASYGPSLYGLGRQAARLVDRILKGARPADLPVEQPTKFELVVNLKAAKDLGLTIPQSVLVRADRLIE
jgi:putative tryptophan/tyrosine transport system substrate-binding protein